MYAQRRRAAASNRPRTELVTVLDKQLLSAFRSLGVILIIAVATALIFRSWSMALIVTAGLVFHELGHILMAAGYGIQWEIVLRWAGVGTLTSLNQRDQLTQYQNSLIHLGGPLASLFLALLAFWVGSSMGYILPDNAWVRLANFSALLALINVLPIGNISDGGRFLERFYASLPERLEPPTILGLLIGLISSAGMLWVTGFELVAILAVMLIGLWLAVTMLFESKRDDPAQAASPKAMTILQGLGLLAMMLVIMLVASLAILTTPFWLHANDAILMAEGLKQFAGFLVSMQGQFGLAALLLLGLAIYLVRLRGRRALP
jgi:hypothetical protein